MGGGWLETARPGVYINTRGTYGTNVLSYKKTDRTFVLFTAKGIKTFSITEVTQNTKTD